jgi:hypothetical protein
MVVAKILLLYIINNKISFLFKNSWNEKKTETTGFFANGSLESWKLPQLLVQLLFSVNKDILPFNTAWSKDNGNLLKRWNVGKVVVNALASILSFHLACRLKVATSDSIDSLRILLNNTRAHLHLLRLLKQDIIRVNVPKH